MGDTYPTVRVAAAQAEANVAVSRSYALETQSFVIHVGGLCDQPTLELLADDAEKRELLRVGGGASQIIDPLGMTISGPLGDNEEGLVIADCEMSKIPAAKMANDPAGHYARGDVTQLLLNRRPRRPVIYRDLEPEPTSAEEGRLPPSGEREGTPD